MKKLYISKSLLLAIGLLLSVTFVNAQVTTTGSGNWNSTTPNAPWPGGTVPATSSAVIIASGHTVTLTTSVSQSGIITVNNGGTLVCSNILNVRNNSDPGTVVNGTIVITVANGLTKAGTGNNPTVRVSATGKIRFGTSGTTGITNWTLSSGSTVEYYGASQTLSSRFISTHYSNLTLSGSDAKNLYWDITVDGTLSIQGAATINLNGHTLSYGSAATLEYNTPTPRTAGSAEWKTSFPATGGVVIANTGTITLDAAKVFNASVPLTINSGATLATNNLQLTFGGNFINNGTLIAGSSPVIITNTVDQNIAGFTTTGTVSMTKTGGTATFTGNVTGVGLTINGSGGTLNLGIGLTHTFSGLVTGTYGILNGGLSTLRLGGAYGGSGGTFIAASGTVEYYAAAPQTVAPLTYNNLTLSGTSAISFPSGVTTVTGVFSREGSTTVSPLTGTLTYGGSATLQYKGSIAQTTGPEFPAIWAGTGGVKIENALGVTLGEAKNIGTTSFTIGNSVAGSIFNDGGYQLTATGTLHLNSGSYIVRYSSFPAFTGGITIDPGTTVNYAATAAQTVKGMTYSNLTISGTGTNSKTADANVTVNGILNLISANASATQGCLHMSAFTLNMGASATTAGNGDVTGIVTRTSFAVNTPYTFGNQFTTLDMSAGGALPTSVSFKIVFTATHSWKTDAIHRYYDIIQTGGDAGTRVILNLHYLETELNGNTETNLNVFDYHVSDVGLDLDDHGHSNSNLTDNWIGLTNRTLTYIAHSSSFPSKYWTLGNSTTVPFTWLGANSTDWTSADNWVGGVPGSSDNAVIPDATTTQNDPALPPTTTIGSLTINSGGILNGGTGTALTLSGGEGTWNNLSGVTGFNAGTSTVLFTNAAATMSGSTNFYNITVANGANLTLGMDNIMRIAGNLSLSTSGVLNAANNHNTVELNGSAQTVVFPNGSTTGYHNLILSGSGAKTMPSSAMTVYGDFSMSGSAAATTLNTLTLLGGFTLSGTATATAGASIAFGGDVTLGSGTAFIPSEFSHTVSGNWINNGAAFSPTAGTIVFNNTSAAQSISGTALTQTFNNITITKSGQALSVGGSTTTLNILNNLWLTEGTLDAGTASSINISKNWTIETGGTFIPQGSTIAFVGSSTQAISGTTTFNNLTINNSAAGSRVILSSAGTTVNGILNLQSANASATQGTLNTGSYTLNMGAEATTTGLGEVTGIIARSAFVASTPYTFGSQFTTLTFLGGGTYPSQIKVKISIGAAPSWKSTSIYRIYDFQQTGGSDCFATFAAHYLDTELNGNLEEKLVMWGYGTSPPLNTLNEFGRSNINLTNNWVSVGNMPIGIFPASFGQFQMSLANSELTSYTWTGSESASWTNPGNWVPAGVPSSTYNVIIPSALTTSFDPLLPENTEINTLTINTGGILDGGSGTTLTVAGGMGAWSNLGTFNPGTSTVVFTNSDATVSGTTNFYNVTINPGTRLATQSGAVIGIAGTMTNNGVWSTVSQGPTMVIYNGGNQTVAIPDVSTNRYSTLILRGTGIKTMPDQEMSIMADFSLSGTASAFATQDIDISGNFTIAAGTSFTSSAAALKVGGNWNNSGTFIAGTGTVSFNGSAAQTINGNNTYNNLTINSAGVTAGTSQTVNGVLNLQSPNASAFSGSLDMGANILDMGPLATTTGTGDVTGIVRRTTFVPQTSYSFGNRFTTVAFIPGGTYPASLQMKLTIGAAPTWNTLAIKRVYELVNTGGSNCFANISMHYLDSELNGNMEERLVKFRWQSPSAITDMGRSNYNTTDNWIENDQVGIGLLPTAFGQVQISMAESTLTSYIWNGSLSSVWENTSNWTPVGSPSDISNVIIPDAGMSLNDPTLRTGGVSLKSVSIENGGVLNSGDQSLTLSGTSGTWINNGTFNAGGGTVTLTGNGGTISGTTNFNNLTINSGADVTNQLGSIVRIGGTMTNNGTWRAALLDNTVEYNGGSQTVLNTNAPITGYHNLILSGSGTKTMPGTALSVYGDLTISGTTTATAGAAMTIGGSVSVESGATLNLGSFSHTISGNLTNTGGTLTSALSSLTFNGSSLQTITSSTGLTLNNLSISNTSAPVTSGTSTGFTIGGNLTVNPGSVFDLTSNTLGGTGSIANSGTIRTANSSATPVPTGKTWGGTFEYYGDAAQTTPAGTYNNLTISGSGGVTAAASLSVNGILNLSFGNPSSTKGSLDMGAYTLTLGGSATDTGIGDVTGIISRTTLNAGVTYTFGNPYMSVYFPADGTRPSVLSAKVSIGTAPSSWISGAISRQLEIIQTGGGGTKALFTYHYLDAELNGNDEEHLVFWVQHSPNIEYGRSANNSTENWVALSNVDVAFFSSSFDNTKNITLAPYSAASTLIWNGSLSDSWTSVENWTPNTIGPSPVRDIIIPDVSELLNSPTLPSETEIKSLTIEVGGILNSSALAQLTINGSAGSWINNGGIFNPGTSNVIFTGANATLSGMTNFYSATINSGSKLQNQTGSVMRISGSMTNSGTWDATLSDNTVEYNASVGQTAAPNTYYNLTLSNSGIKTTTGVTINGILSMEGTATASVAPAYGASASLQYNTSTLRSAGSEWITPFTSTGGVIIANTGIISLNESKVLNTSVPLTINSGAGLTIGSLYSLTVNGNLTNNAGTSGLVIKSDATNGDGKLINNSPDVASTVELYMTGGTTGGNKFHFFVPPVSTMAVGTTLQNVNDNLGITSFHNDLMSYSEAAAGGNQNLGWQYYDGYTGSTGFTSAPFTSLISSKGYNIYLTADDIIKFKGTLNNAPHTFILNRSPNCLGWNLVGNPYPCNYNLTGVSALTTADNGVDKSIYFAHNGSYAVWNLVTHTGTSGYSDIVPPMQGFFVHVWESGNSLILPAGSKTASAATPRSKGSSQAEADIIEKIKLVLSNSTQSDETIVCLIDKATNGFDSEYDAYKLFGSSTIPYIYTELGSVKYAINSVPLTVSEPVIIPVTVVLKSPGTYKIDATEFTIPVGIKVILKHGSAETILTNNTSYSFTSAAGTFTDFQLIIGGTPTVIDNLKSGTLKTWYNNNFLYINCPSEIISGKGNLIIYDMQGKLVLSNTQLYFTPGQTLQLPVTLPNGVYAVRVIINNQPFVSKIVIL